MRIRLQVRSTTTETSYEEAEYDGETMTDTAEYATARRDDARGGENAIRKRKVEKGKGGSLTTMNHEAPVNRQVR